MKLSIYKLLLGSAAVFGLAAVGCDDELTMSDVESQREAVEEKEADLREAEEEAHKEIAEEQEDVEDVAREEREGIEEEREELAEEKAELADIEEEFANQQEREAYIEQQRTALNDAGRRLDTLEADAAKLEDDDARDARETELESVRALYDDANDKFGELDATDEEGWKLEHSAFAQAFARLETEMSKLGTADDAVFDPAAPEPIAPPLP